MYGTGLAGAVNHNVSIATQSLTMKRRMEEVMAKAERINERLSCATNTIGIAAERLLGPQPSKVSNGGGVPCGPGSLAALSGKLDDIARGLDLLEAVAQLLDTTL